MFEAESSESQNAAAKYFSGSGMFHPNRYSNHFDSYLENHRKLDLKYLFAIRINPLLALDEFNEFDLLHPSAVNIIN